MRYVFVYGTLRNGEVNDIGHAAARHGLLRRRCSVPSRCRANCTISVPIRE